MTISPSKNTADLSVANDNSKVQHWCIDADIAGQRIDNYLISRLKGVPKSLIYRILRKGEVRVNKGRVKPEYKLKSGDIVRIPPVRVSSKEAPLKPSTSLAERLNSAVLYEDDALLVINKPSGLAVHGGSGVQLGLIESLRHIREGAPFLELIHRLDKATSGCVMIAKSRRCLRYMQQLLREGGIDKVYNALVIGRWPKRRKAINVALLKSLLANGERIVRAVEEGSPGAKPSRTEYRILKHYQTCSLIEAKPITGRTHQIRVHCQYAGHAILGDDKYGFEENLPLEDKLKLKRLFLHAARLNFTHLDNRDISIEAPLSDDLLSVIERLDVESAE